MAEKEQMGHVQDFKSLCSEVGLYVQLCIGAKEAPKEDGEV